MFVINNNTLKTLIFLKTQMNDQEVEEEEQRQKAELYKKYLSEDRTILTINGITYKTIAKNDFYNETATLLNVETFKDFWMKMFSISTMPKTFSRLWKNILIVSPIESQKRPSLVKNYLETYRDSTLDESNQVNVFLKVVIEEKKISFTGSYLYNEVLYTSIYNEIIDDELTKNRSCFLSEDPPDKVISNIIPDTTKNILELKDKQLLLLLHLKTILDDKSVNNDFYSLVYINEKTRQPEFSWPYNGNEQRLHDILFPTGQLI